MLDEPTSALDPPAAEEVLAALQRIVHDLGLTVVLAEHRLERVVQFADRVIHVEQGRVEVGEPEAVMATANVAPPVVELARLAKWDPIPLSVRDARRAAGGLRDTLTERPINAARSGNCHSLRKRSPVLRVDAVVAGYGNIPVLHEMSLAIEGGEIVALMGRNGAGKSTLLRTLVGLTKPEAGSVEVSGADPADLSPAELLPRICLVPQEPADLLWTDSVARECRQADLDGRAPSGAALALFSQLAPGVLPGYASTRPFRRPTDGTGHRHHARRILRCRAARRAHSWPRLRHEAATRCHTASSALQTDAPSSSPPTMSSWSLKWLPEPWCWLTVKSSRTDRHRKSSLDPPSSHPKCRKSSAPLPFLTVAGVADAISKAG